MFNWNEVSQVQYQNGISISNLCQPYPELLMNKVKTELQKNFTHVSLDFIICPDLRKYNLIAPGLCQKTAIMDIGSTSYLFPKPQLHKKYCFGKLLFQLHRLHNYNFIIGMGKHSNPPLYDHADFSANMLFDPLNNVYNETKKFPKLRNQNKAIWCDESRNIIKYTEVHDTTCAIQGNFFLSEGFPGGVFYIRASNRFGPEDYLTSIYRGLTKTQTIVNAMIGLGGIFLTNDTRYHNMHLVKLSKETQQRSINNRSTNYTINVGTMMSDSFGQHNLYKYHNNNWHIMHFTKLNFHSIVQDESVDHSDTSHHHCSTLLHHTADYVGYFSLAEKYYAVDPEWLPLHGSPQPNHSNQNYHK